jgi:hypothetical protein
MGHFAITGLPRKFGADSASNPTTGQNSEALSVGNVRATADPADAIPYGLYGVRPETYGGGSVPQFNPYEDDWGNQLEED